MRRRRFLKTSALGLGALSLSNCDNLSDLYYSFPGSIYAATFGGLSISSDGGKSFSNKTTANGLGDNNVNNVFVTETTIYAACGNGVTGGLSISTDGGNTFINRDSSHGIVDNYVYDVYVNESGTIFTCSSSGASGGVSISTDGGNTFAGKTTADGLSSNDVFGVIEINSKIYAATASGLDLSTDGGNSYTNLLPGAFSSVFVYGASIIAGDDGGAGLYISTDGGSTFIQRTNSNSGLANDAVRGVFYTDNKIYATTNTGLSVSENGGSSFQTILSFAVSSTVDVFVFGSNIYVATTADGLSISNDSGSSFTQATQASNGLGNDFVNGVFFF